MKRSQLAAVAVLAFAATAHAQNKITPLAPSAPSISGTVDVGVTRGVASGKASGSLTALTSSNQSSSRLTFRGVEDLGGGLFAHFHLEGQLYPDKGSAGAAVSANNQTIASRSGSGVNFSRRSTVGIMSRTWGEIRFGRDVTPSAWNLADSDPFSNSGVGATISVPGPVGGLGAGAIYQITPAGLGTAGPYIRSSNAFIYLTPPTLAGFYGHYSHFLGENPQNGSANEKDGSGDSLRLGYAAGKLHASFGYLRIRYKATPTGTAAGSPSGDVRNVNAMLNYDLGALKLKTAVTRDVRESPLESVGTGWNVGGIIPVGRGEIKVSVGKYTIDAGPATADPSSTKIAVGYVHNLSKRTALYATAANLRNRNGARSTIGGAPIGAGLSSSDVKAFDLGIRHHF